MAAPTLNSISPLSGPPGTAVTLTGSGFDPAAQVGCPVLVDTTFVSAGELQAAIPADLAGADGAAMPVSVFIQNEDGSISGILTFTVRFGVEKQQTYTTLDAVIGEVPGFKLGGDITSNTVLGWMRSIAQQINAAMLRRGLSLNPTDWQQPGAGSGMPEPAGVLELINRYGAASRLSAAISARFSAAGEWALAKQLRTDFTAQMTALESGQHDKLFKPSAATVEAGTLFAAGDMTGRDGRTQTAFRKEQVF